MASALQDSLVLESGGRVSYTSVEPQSPPHSPGGNGNGEARAIIPAAHDSSMWPRSRKKTILVGVFATFGVAIVSAGLCTVLLKPTEVHSRTPPGPHGNQRSEATHWSLPGIFTKVQVTSTSSTTSTTETTTGTTATNTSTHTATSTSTTSTKTTSSSTRTASSTTTSITTTTRTHTVTTRPYPSLFCVSVMRADGYELSLVRSQLARGVSIFSCDDWAVYSDKRIWLTPGPPVRIDTAVLKTSLSAPAGTVEHILNTNIFMEVFDRMKVDGRYKLHNWVVKVDPDAVFFPGRLKSHVKHISPHGGLTRYVLNCKASFKLFGALEVFSRKAVDVYLEGQHRCREALPWKKWGEDLWMRRCLDFLNVTHVEDYGLLTDAYCGDEPRPCVSGRVAFHPFKSPHDYFACWDQAKAAGAASPKAALG